MPPVEVTYGPKDCMLYALGVGLGHDPMNEDELAFVYEKELKVLPTMATVLGYGVSWAREAGIDQLRVVNGEQGFTLHKPLEPEATVVGRSRIIEVIDKGAGKGALILSERKVSDKASGELIATVTQTTFCRGDGGFGGPPREAPAPHPIPERAPDMVCDLPTRPEMALIYRLSGDYNPLHAEPAVRQGRRLRAPDPARPRHFRRFRARGAQDDVRLRSRTAWRRSPAASPRRCFPARRSAPRCGATATW